MTEPLIMGLKAEPRVMDTSQSNRGTPGHHLP